MIPKKVVIILVGVLALLMFLVWLVTNRGSLPFGNNISRKPVDTKYGSGSNTDINFNKPTALPTALVTPMSQAQLDAAVQAVKKKLPVNTADFAIIYSTSAQKFIIQKKSVIADTKIREWAKQNKVESLLTNPNVFSYVDSTPVPLSSDAQTGLATVQKMLPYETADFRVEYNSTLNQVVVISKTSQGKALADQWLKNNGTSLLISEKVVVYVDKKQSVNPTTSDNGSSSSNQGGGSGNNNTGINTGNDASNGSSGSNDLSSSGTAYPTPTLTDREYVGNVIGSILDLGSNPNTTPVPFTQITPYVIKDPQSYEEAVAPLSDVVNFVAGIVYPSSNEASNSNGGDNTSDNITPFVSYTNPNPSITPIKTYDQMCGNIDKLFGQYNFTQQQKDELRKFCNSVAPTATVSNTQNGSVTDLGQSSSGPVIAASDVYGIVANIRNNCHGEGVTGRVRDSNISCLNGTTNSSLAINKWKESASKYTYLQCVGFVYGIEAAISGVDMFCSGIGPAVFSTTCPQSGKFTFIPYTSSTANLHVGDAVLWRYADVGHIAYVTKIFDNNNFEVAEANNSPGVVRMFNKTIDNPDIIGWVRLK
ncbi:CHAP domain-containing protein [Candidatus Roizmanbacteria bacterium]|nr:CHAP domain-containing protein [Candidatus Roizmanbacteria bacterium]